MLYQYCGMQGVCRKRHKVVNLCPFCVYYKSMYLVHTISVFLVHGRAADQILHREPAFPGQQIVELIRQRILFMHYI